MFGLDIGTLAGRISVEDEFTSTFRKFDAEINRVGQSLQRYAVVTVGALAGATAAVAGYGAAIVALGQKGSTITGVTEAFNRLSASVGETGEAMLNQLSEGVRHTVDGTVLMQQANRALSAGVKLTAEDMRTLGATARE